jgi:hypothetical protein
MDIYWSGFFTGVSIGINFMILLYLFLNKEL